MNCQNLRCPCSAFSLVVGAVLMTLSSASSGAPLTKESREVKAAVAKAVQCMASGSPGYDVGGDSLVGLALLKAKVSPDHPKVKLAVNNIRRSLARESSDKKLEYGKLYTPSMMLLFLLELDSQRYRSEITRLLRYLHETQKHSATANGGWGYLTGTHYVASGDTSMTQYAVLAYWEANEAGFKVRTESIEGALVWLMKTQLRNGGYAYQGTIPTGSGPANQGRGTHTMSAAGVGSVYICADMLGLTDKVREEDDGLPPGLKIAEQRGPGKHKTSISRNAVQNVEERGNGWFRENFTVDPKQWTHYYLYGMERYYSFRELTEGRISDRPNWYHEIARFLVDSQLENGNWEGHGGGTIPAAFATLFLIRSAKGSIERTRDFGGGTMVGGRGLPKDTDSIRVRRGQVVSSISLGSVEEMLAAAEGSEDDSYFEAIEALAGLPAEEAKALISKQADKLRKMAGGTSPKQRLAAVRALAKARNFDDVPMLIYVLNDADPDVVFAARDGLRRISRKFDGLGLSEGCNAAELEAAINKWKDWYLAIRPDAVFED